MNNLSKPQWRHISKFLNSALEMQKYGWLTIDEMNIKIGNEYHFIEQDFSHEIVVVISILENGFYEVLRLPSSHYQGLCVMKPVMALPIDNNLNKPYFSKFLHKLKKYVSGEVK